MTGFTYAAPTTVQEALNLLDEHGEDATLLAGGQSLMILLRQRLVSPKVLVGLKGVAELRELDADDGHMRIGAMVPYCVASSSPLLRDRLPALAQAAASVGSVHIRTLGTIGGSVCHADPAGDVPTVLLASDASLVLKRADGSEVTYHVDDFFTGLFETRRQPDELLVSIQVPDQPAGATFSYRRYYFRAGEYPLCVVACRLEWEADRCVGARVAVGGGGPHPMRLSEVEQQLVGTDGSAIDTGSIARAARDVMDPTPDVRGSAEWKATVVASVLDAALTEAIEGRTQRV
jgi:aerobic carbon-monoxide dehydrogenase medium subunit